MRRPERIAGGTASVTTIDAALRLLAESIRDQRFCLVIGAGASSDIKVPAWVEIVQRIADQRLLGGCELDDRYRCPIATLAAAGEDALRAHQKRVLYRAVLGSGPDLPWLYDQLEALGSIKLADFLYIERVQDRDWVGSIEFLDSASPGPAGRSR